MERGLSGFCQSFDGVIDCERYQGQGARIQTDVQNKEGSASEVQNNSPH